MTTRPHLRRPTGWWPASRAGRRAVVSAGLSVTGILLLVLGFATDLVEPADTYTDSPPQLVWGAGIWGCALVALVSGLVAIVRRHDRSGAVLVATALGLLPVVLLLSEIARGDF